MLRSIAARIRVLHDSGVTAITAGTCILGFLAIDSYLVSKKSSQRVDEIHRLEAAYNIKKEEQERRYAEEYRRKLTWIYGGMEHNFLRKITYIPHEGKWDGKLALTKREVQVGDVLEILEEGVGPDKAYHLCRVQNKGNIRDISGAATGGHVGDPDVELLIGWYPARYLENT